MDKNQPRKNRKIFTLAYLKSHSIIIESKETDKIDVSCAVVILLPFNEDNQEFTRNNYNLIEKNILIKMDLYGKFIYNLTKKAYEEFKYQRTFF